MINKTLYNEWDITEPKKIAKNNFDIINPFGPPKELDEKNENI